MQIQLIPYIDVNQNKINDNEYFKVYCSLFAGTVTPPRQYYAYIVSIYYFTKLAETLPLSLDKLGYAEFENKYQDLIGLTRYLRSDAKKSIPNSLESFIPQEDLIDQFDQVLFSCKLESIREIHEEYVRRIREIKKEQFFHFFLQKKPSIQHKAGVPLRGTFIIVYHEAPKLVGIKPGVDGIIANTPTYDSSKVYTDKLSTALNRISARSTLVADPDVRFLLDTFTGQIPDISIKPPSGASEKVDEIIEKGVNEFADGTVIADFYLPYLCCSECAPIQYVLPMPPLGLLVKLECTDSKTSTAKAKLTPQGGTPPFTYKLDNQPFREFQGELLLSTGPHTLIIRDNAGSESMLQSLTVPEPLTIGSKKCLNDFSAETYRISFQISGGTPPYKSNNNSGTVKGNTFTSTLVTSNTLINVEIEDSAGCNVSKDFQHNLHFNYIKTWLVLGPIFNPKHQTGNHPPDRTKDGHPWAEEIIKDIDNHIDPLGVTGSPDRAPVEGNTLVYGDKSGQIFDEKEYTWQTKSFSGIDWKNISAIGDNIHNYLPGVEDKHHALIFFVTYICSLADKNTTLYVRSDDSIRVWLNGEEIKELSYIGERNIKDYYDEKCADISLKKGNNILMAAVAETHVEWGFSARIDDDNVLEITPKHPSRSQYKSISIPSEGNGWNPTKRSLLYRGYGIWEEKVEMFKEEKFKFAANGNWKINWGKNGTKNGENISFKKESGTYDVTFDENDPGNPIFTPVQSPVEK